MFGHELSRLAILISSACASAACGGDHDLGGALLDDGGAGAPSEVPEVPGGIGLCSQGAEFELIDDMEDEDSAILLDVDGRSGVWFAFNDESGGEQHPSPNEPFLMEQLDPARDSSRYAAWTAGEGFVEWGGGIGFELKSQKSYDATRYGGFAFWARRAPGGAVRLRADVTDRNTTPYGRQCNDKTMCDRGRACDPAAMACYDNFGVAVELDEDWTFFSYRWEDLSQVGWSGNVYPEITRSAIYGIRFQSEPEGEFEFWIDDVAFVCDAR